MSPWSLPMARANSRSPSLSSTSAKWVSLPTSRPTHTLTCSGVATQAPSPCVEESPFEELSDKLGARDGALAAIHLTNERFAFLRVACPHQRFTHQRSGSSTPRP